MPHFTFKDESFSNSLARDSSWGLEALQGPHHVAEKVMNVEGWVDRKVERDADEDSSCRVILIVDRDEYWG